MEGHWETSDNVPLVLFGWPDAINKSNRYALELPGVASFILTHDVRGIIKGINEFAEHPPVAPVFFAFRIMVGVGMLMLLVSWASAWQLWRKQRVNEATQWVLLGMAFSGWVAVVAGWYTTEIGRQPYLVQGVLKTADAVTTVPGGMVAGTLIAYLVIYLILIAAYIKVVFYLARKACDGGKKLDEKAFSSAAVKKAVEGEL